LEQTASLKKPDFQLDPEGKLRLQTVKRENPLFAEAPAADGPVYPMASATSADTSMADVYNTGVSDNPYAQPTQFVEQQAAPTRTGSSERRGTIFEAPAESVATADVPAEDTTPMASDQSIAAITTVTTEVLSETVVAKREKVTAGPSKRPTSSIPLSIAEQEKWKRQDSLAHVSPPKAKRTSDAIETGDAVVIDGQYQLKQDLKEVGAAPALLAINEKVTLETETDDILSKDGKLIVKKEFKPVRGKHKSMMRADELKEMQAQALANKAAADAANGGTISEE
jgi:hypothetical protein